MAAEVNEAKAADSTIVYNARFLNLTLAPNTYVTAFCIMLRPQYLPNSLLA